MLYFNESQLEQSLYPIDEGYDVPMAAEDSPEYGNRLPDNTSCCNP